jgi:hypothetical protein
MWFQLPTATPERVRIFLIFCLPAWGVLAFLVYIVGDPTQPSAGLSKEALTLFGAFIVLMAAFYFNRAGQQRNFFYQKQINEVVAYASNLDQVIIIAAMNEVDRKKYMDRFMEQIFRPNVQTSYFLVEQWAERKFLEPERVYEQWEVILETLLTEKIVEKIARVDEEPTMADVFAGLHLLTAINHWQGAASLAAVIKLQIQDSLGEEFWGLL